MKNYFRPNYRIGRFFAFLFTGVLICFNVSNAQWFWQNPLPTGNDLFGVSFTDASNGTVTGFNGTILRTTNGGVDWIPQTSGVTVFLRNVSFTDANTGTAVGLNGTILRTTDGGVNWILQTSGTTQGIQNVSFTDANNGTVVGNAGTILRTTNGGVNWIPQISGVTAQLMGVHFIDANTGTAVGGGGTILRTINGGVNWIPQTSGLTSFINGVFFTDANTGTVVGASGKILRTTDGGVNWIPQTSGVTTTLSNISFTDANTGTVVGSNKILRTTNGGADWFEQVHTVPLVQGVSFTDANTGTVVGAYGSILRTTNGGTSWVPQSSYVTIEVLSDVCFTSSYNGTVVGQNGTILRTTNGGVNWIRLTSGTADNLTGVSFINANTGTVVGTSGIILRTTDGGVNWIRQYSPSAILRAVSLSDIRVGTAIGTSIVRTTDGGASWYAQTNPTTNTLMDVCFTDDKNGTIVGFNGTILRTIDGENWIPQTSGTTTHLTSVSFTDENNGTVVGFSGVILRTTNGGVNWIPQTSGTTAALNGVSFIDANNGTIAVESGSAILRTTNGGVNWILQPSGTNNFLYAVCCTDINNATVVGGAGTILNTGVAAPTTFQLTVEIANGWNMVSIPGLHPTDQNVNTWWAFRDMGANVFKYAGGYQSVPSAIPGLGYWMKHSEARTYNTGDEWPAGGIEIVAHAPLAGASGWNLIGGYEKIVTAALVTTIPPGLQSGPIYKYSGGYAVATTLDPGYGYWIKLTGDGQIIIPEFLAKGTEVVEYFPGDWGKIVLTDATGINYTLYAVKGEINLDQYELPPAPMAGMFDIRYSSGRIAEDLNSAIRTIEMSGVTYPLTVRVEGMDIRLMDETGKGVNVNLQAGEDVVISDATIQKLMVSGGLIPAKYALEQNYPNPFNPSTVIEFSLPENVGNVKLSIYNMLGEKVAELVNAALTAGKYQYQWNASNVATGMYIYELRTDKFVSVKKMLMIK